MKKFLSVLFFAAALAAFALSACNKNASGVAELVETDGNTVVLRAVKTDTSLSLADALQSLKDEGKLDFTVQNGDYGLEILSVNGYAPDSDKNEFWAIYTTLGEYEGASYSNTEWVFEYGGKTLGTSNFGVSGLPMVEGELYVITISINNF